MIVAKQIPLEEMRKEVSDCERILVLGCGTCVAICMAGGEREVGIVASSLRMAEKMSGNEKVFHEHTVQRQCEWEFLEDLTEKLKGVDAILSLGCGVGVQAVAEKFPELPVLPGLNTVFMGMPEQEGIWTEKCSGCGDCVLHKTGGICPVTTCRKGLLNGPCGGTRKGGKCEVDPEKDCAWVLIYQRLERQGRLDLIHKYHPMRNFLAIPRPGKVKAETVEA